MTSAAHAEPLASGVEPTGPTEPPAALMAVPTTVRAPLDEPDWQAAPSPRDASGVAREDARTGRLLWIPRALFFLPRMAVWTAAQPIRGVAYAYERYDVPTKSKSATSSDARRFGIYPTAAYETGFGFTAGGRLIVRDIFGANERVKLRVDFGGRFRQAYGINLKSGDRFGDRLTLEVDSSYERRPQERFFGIGNGGKLDQPPPMPIDPSVDNTSIESRFGETLVRNVLTADVRIVDSLHARTSGALMLRELSGTDDPDSITMRYDTSKLAGFEDGVQNLYIEEELVYDTRRPAKYQSHALDVTGWLAAAHVGITRGINGDPSKFWTYGGEVQRYFDLYDGSRVLVLRGLVEAIAGSDGRTDGKVSFVDLPRLGGAEHLRGYPNGRFRDRSIALGSAEYTWNLGNFLAAFTFVDVGRTFSALDNVETDDGLRVGFGGGVQVHTGKSFLTRLQIAGSRDGDFFLELALSPTDGRRERARRF
ncbi:MAG: outer membrane protein assembly factor [Myxococcota bacterium]|nr:outer membrane protein assembly factor [Myxococcota bacterium]